MTIAIPVWHHRVAPVFDTIQKITVFKYENGEFISLKELSIGTFEDELKIRSIVESGVSVLICGAIPFRFEKVLTDAGITVFPFIAGEISVVLDAYKTDQLNDPKYKMPGCRNLEQRGLNCRFK
jgi:predicted Fe-Mo cluster-binding NifX family protein